MSDRARPPRARPPSSFYLDDTHPAHQVYSSAAYELQQDQSPDGSRDGHGYQSNSQSSRGKNLPPAPGTPPAHGEGPFDDGQAAYAGVAGNSSPRSSYSDGVDTPQQQLQLRHVAGAREAHVEGSSLHPGYAGSVRGVQGAMPTPHHQYNQSMAAASDRESFFAPPQMPWMRGEGSTQGGHSAPPSRPESPSFFGGGGAPRTSSASPMPYFPSSSGASFYGGASGPASTYLGVSGFGGKSGPKRTFQSNLLQGPVDKPWKTAKDPWKRVAWWTTVVLWFAGLAGAAVLSFFAYRDTPSVGKVCLSFNEEFTDPALGRWTKEVGVGGYGTGGFEWTTASEKNVVVKGGKLYIIPTLTRDSEGISQDQILSGYGPKAIDGCTSTTDSTAYFKDKPLGSAAGLKKREAQTGFVKRAMGMAAQPFDGLKRAVSYELGARTNARDADPAGDVASYGFHHEKRQGPGTGTGNGGTGTGNGGTGTGNGGTGTGNGGTGTGNGGTGNGGTGTGNGGTGNGGTGTGNGGTGTGNGGTGTGTGTGTKTGDDKAGANGVTGGGAGAAANGQHDPCNVVSDLTAKHAVNPVQSARLSTKGAEGGTILYGRVEVKAKLPTGDWLFPQIMMLPKDAEYGAWPFSGEIDLMLARGNDANYPKGGRDFITGGLQWGPGAGFNAFDRTRGWWQERRTNFNQAFHTFTLEWTPDFMWIFVDRRVNRLIDLRFNKQSFFERGKFPLTFQNGTDTVLLRNPWEKDGKTNRVAPFDKEFYMILTVGAGGTNGWFPDNAGNKPWFDRSNAAMFDFANTTDTWHKTWPAKDDDRAMVVEYVKFSKKC